MNINSRLTKIYSFILALILVVISTLFPTFATTHTEQKSNHIFDRTLSEMIITATSDELIPVSIWYQDIDQDEIDLKVKKQTGLTEDNVDVVMSMPSLELLDGYNQSSADNDGVLEEYFVKTANQRTIERRKTNDFIKIRRELCSEKYMEESSDLVVDLGIEQERIIFMSRYAPMIIANLTVNEIKDLDGESRIQSVSFYQEPEEEVCTVESVHETTNINHTSDVFGLTGEGVKIGVFEKGGFPDSTCNELKNASITNVGA